MPISKYDYLVDTYIGIKLDPASYLSMYELHFTSELVSGSVNYGKIVQFSSQTLTRR